MERKLSILAPIFDDPDNQHHIREIARKTQINHTTVRQYLNKLVKEGILTKTTSSLTTSYKPTISQVYLNLKKFYNLEQLRNSKLIEHLQDRYDLPTIILFGSYAKATNNAESDIDLAVVTNITKQPNLQPYEKKLNRTINLHHFTKTAWKNATQKNPALINSIANGIVLSGELEIR